MHQCFVTVTHRKRCGAATAIRQKHVLGCSSLLQVLALVLALPTLALILALVLALPTLALTLALVLALRLLILRLHHTWVIMHKRLLGNIGPCMAFIERCRDFALVLALALGVAALALALGVALAFVLALALTLRATSFEEEGTCCEDVLGPCSVCLPASLIVVHNPVSKGC